MAKQMASGYTGHMPLAPCLQPPPPQCSLLDPLGSPEAGPDSPLLTRNLASRADPSPGPRPGEGGQGLQAPNPGSPVPRSSALPPARAWAVASCDTSPQSPHTHAPCTPPELAGGLGMCPVARWPVADRPLDFENYLIPGF